MLLLLARDFEKVGKVTIAKETPIIPTGKRKRLLAKLNIATLPAAIREVIAVITIKLI